MSGEPQALTAIDPRDFQPAGGKIRFDRKARQLTVSSPRPAWAYAAILKLDRERCGAGRAVVSFTVRVEHGHIGFGVLNAQQTHFLNEEGVRDSDGLREVRLSVDAIENAGALVIRNLATGNNASRAVIESITIETMTPAATSRHSETKGSTTGRAAPAQTTSQYWFKRYLETEIPALTNPAATDWERVCAMRDWAYARISLGESTASILEARYEYAIYQEPLEEIMRKLDSGEGGFLCAGFSVMLKRLYELFGYSAYTYNMGSPSGSPTHMVSLVDIAYEGQTITTVQDSLFNLSLVREGKPLDFAGLLSFLQRRRAGDADITGGTRVMKPVVGSPEKIDRWIEANGSHYVLGSRTVTSSQARVDHNLSIGNYHRRYIFENWLESEIGERDLRYLYLCPLGSSGGSKAEALVEAAREARRTLSQHGAKAAG